MVSVLNPKRYRITDISPDDAYYRSPEKVVGAVVCEERNKHHGNPLVVTNGRARGWCDIVKAAPGVDNFHTYPTGGGYDAGETICFWDVGVEELP